MVDRPSKRQCGARMRRSRSPWTARGRCADLASILAGADATEQGALAPSPRVRGQELIGRSPSALLLLPPNPRAVWPAARLLLLAGKKGSDPAPLRIVVAANVGARGLTPTTPLYRYASTSANDTELSQPLSREATHDRPLPRPHRQRPFVPLQAVGAVASPIGLPRSARRSALGASVTVQGILDRARTAGA